MRARALSDGAIVTFTGIVRDFNANTDVVAIELEHYPEMTEKSLDAICKQARDKWPLGEIRVIHRIGKILAHEQIVFVGVSAKHRKAAFDACQFIMDFLKNDVPLWKKEISPKNSIWVAAKASDKASTHRWSSK
jgi:molybdopterin synthase catalytic subunit